MYFLHLWKPLTPINIANFSNYEKTRKKLQNAEALHKHHDFVNTMMRLSVVIIPKIHSEANANTTI